MKLPSKQRPSQTDNLELEEDLERTLFLFTDTVRDEV